MDTSDRFITFDSNGVCNHCTTYFNRLQQRNNSAADSSSIPIDVLFRQIRDASQRRNSTYDAVLGLSGGVDSSYLLHLCLLHGLRILAVHVDNGWDTSTSLHNIKNLVNHPHVTFKSIVLDWNLFRNVQRAFIEAAVPDIELPTDIAITKYLFELASQYGIRTILGGGNLSSEGILPATWMYNARDMKYARSIVSAANLPSSSFSQLHFGLLQEIYHRFKHSIKIVYPLDHIDYDKNVAKQFLSDRYKWKAYGEKHSESVFTRFCQLIYQPRLHSFEYRRAHLSCDICSGRTSRTEALDLLSRPPLTSLQTANDIRFVASKLGFTEDYLISLLNREPLWYFDYPNNITILSLVYSLYRFVSRKPKLSNF
jgi:hypothetical protein